MTREEFLAFYPQFDGVAPGIVLDEYLRQANARFGDFGEDADEARRLYTAHKLTLWAGKGETRRQVASKKVGEVAVTYATSSGVSEHVSTGFAELTETEYGGQLLGLIREYMRPRYLR